MYKTVRTIHLWLSVPFGLLLSVICLTGLILLFEPAHSQGAERPEFFLNVMRLHRWLMDAPAAKGAMSVGKMVVGVSAAAMVLIVISGIMLWWQRARRNLAKSLRITFGKGWHAFCMTFHTAAGAYVALLLLVMALTGLTWSFGFYREWFTSLFGIAKGSHVIYAIHTGAFGGITTKILWFIGAFVGFTLPLTGYCLWLKKR